MTRVKLTAYVVSIVYSLALFITGLHLPGLAAKLVSLLPTVIVLAFAFFDSWLWRRAGINKRFHRPNLVGTWYGDLVSMQTDTNGREITADPIPVVLAITETFTTISVTLMTKESKSRSVAEQLVKNANGDHTLHYQYRNIPRLPLRDQSPEHAGSVVIDVPDLAPTTLDGEYWTNRRTRGTFAISHVSQQTAGSFEAGEQMTTAKGSK